MHAAIVVALVALASLVAAQGYRDVSVCAVLDDDLTPSDRVPA